MTLAEMRLRQESLLKAINKIENGAQEYRIGQQTVRRADLATLYKQWQEQEIQIARQERPTMTVAYLRRRR